MHQEEEDDALVGVIEAMRAEDWEARRRLGRAEGSGARHSWQAMPGGLECPGEGCRKQAGATAERAQNTGASGLNEASAQGPAGS
eukprot:8055357-Alexandrium_andersonii.AAC.1